MHLGIDPMVLVAMNFARPLLPKRRGIFMKRGTFMKRLLTFACSHEKPKLIFPKGEVVGKGLTKMPTQSDRTETVLTCMGCTVEWMPHPHGGHAFLAGLRKQKRPNGLTQRSTARLFQHGCCRYCSAYCSAPA